MSIEDLSCSYRSSFSSVIPFKNARGAQSDPRFLGYQQICSGSLYRKIRDNRMFDLARKATRAKAD